LRNTLRKLSKNFIILKSEFHYIFIFLLIEIKSVIFCEYPKIQNLLQFFLFSYSTVLKILYFLTQSTYLKCLLLFRKVTCVGCIDLIPKFTLLLTRTFLIRKRQQNRYQHYHHHNHHDNYHHRCHCHWKSNNNHHKTKDISREHQVFDLSPT